MRSHWRRDPAAHAADLLFGSWAGMPIAMVSGKKGELHVLVDHPFGIHSYTGNHSAYSITPLGAYAWNWSGPSSCRRFSAEMAAMDGCR